MRRTVLGLITLALLGTAVALTLWPHPEANEFIRGLCVRVGLILGAWWMAYHQVERLPPTVYVGLFLTVLLVAATPRRWFIFAIPLVIILILSHPRLRLNR